MDAAQKDERKRDRINKKAMRAEETVKRQGTARKAKPKENLAKDRSCEILQCSLWKRTGLMMMLI